MPNLEGRRVTLSGRESFQSYSGDHSVNRSKTLRYEGNSFEEMPSHGLGAGKITCQLRPKSGSLVTN